MDNFNDIIKSSKPTLVDFFATWCGPCKMQSPIIDKVKESMGESANVIKIDIDNNQRLAALYHVRSVPTLILFKDGEPLWRTVGVQTQDVLETKIREYTSSKYYTHSFFSSFFFVLHSSEAALIKYWRGHFLSYRSKNKNDIFKLFPREKLREFMTYGIYLYFFIQSSIF